MTTGDHPMSLPVQTQFAETDRIAYFTMEIAVDQE